MGDTLNMKTTFYLVVIAAVVIVVQGNVSGSNPSRNSCLCIRGIGVNVRSTACGSVIIGSSSTGQCFRYTGSKISCRLNGIPYEFFQINWNGRNGWVAGNYLDQSSESRCGVSGTPVSNEYTCAVTHAGKRVQETLSATPYDCKDSRCGNTCKGGQCVAYVTCNCKRNGKWAPNTNCWKPGRKVKTADGKCNRNIAANTAIATFQPNGKYYGHAAVFIKCIDDRTVQIYDQYCGKSVGLSTYSSSHKYFSTFATITNTACADRNSWPCRVENSGLSTCPASQPKC